VQPKANIRRGPGFESRRGPCYLPFCVFDEVDEDISPWRRIWTGEGRAEVNHKERKGGTAVNFESKLKISHVMERSWLPRATAEDQQASAPAVISNLSSRLECTATIVCLILQLLTFERSTTLAQSHQGF
jgi:hypothetical protein